MENKRAVVATAKCGCVVYEDGKTASCFHHMMGPEEWTTEIMLRELVDEVLRLRKEAAE